MPRRDSFHKTVCVALEKEGWTITDDPLTIVTPETDLFIDLGLEKYVGAEKEQAQIAVEVKSFTEPAKFYSFYEAMGQTLIYRLALEDAGMTQSLFLAMPHEVFAILMKLTIFRRAISFYKINLLVFDTNNQTIQQWLRH